MMECMILEFLNGKKEWCRKPIQCENSIKIPNLEKGLDIQIQNMQGHSLQIEGEKKTLNFIIPQIVILSNKSKAESIIIPILRHNTGHYKRWIKSIRNKWGGGSTFKVPGIRAMWCIWGTERQGTLWSGSAEQDRNEWDRDGGEGDPTQCGNIC